LSLGLIGKKSGMSRVFQEDGDSIPVSIVSVFGNYVAGIKTKESDGYDAVLVSKTENKKNRSKSQKEFFAKVNVTPGTLNEFKLSENSDRNIGDHLTADLFEVGQYVDVTGTSKGKGYAGVIKRHNFKMQDATHGNSLSHRAHGSIGQCQTPGRVWKGKKMSGHMGNERKTVQNLEIINIDVENNLLFIKGAIPGFNGSKVTIKPSIKK
jgi:large subunit ribosomal protein L3